MQIFHQLRQQTTKLNVSRNNNNMKKLQPIYIQEQTPNNSKEIKAKLLKFPITSIKQHRTHSTTALIESLHQQEHL